MPYTHKPKFPVVDQDPSVGKVVSNFHLDDWFYCVAFPAAGYMFGYYSSRKPLRVHNARIITLIGAMGGVAYSFQNSLQRFVGLRPNEAEVSRYGVMTEEQLKKFYLRSLNPNIKMIDSDED